MDLQLGGPRPVKSLQIRRRHQTLEKEKAVSPPQIDNLKKKMIRPGSSKLSQTLFWITVPAFTFACAAMVTYLDGPMDFSCHRQHPRGPEDRIFYRIVLVEEPEQERKGHN